MSAMLRDDTISGSGSAVLANSRARCGRARLDNSLLTCEAVSMPAVLTSQTRKSCAMSTKEGWSRNTTRETRPLMKGRRAPLHAISATLFASSMLMQEGKMRCRTIGCKSLVIASILANFPSSSRSSTRPHPLSTKLSAIVSTTLWPHTSVWRLLSAIASSTGKPHCRSKSGKAARSKSAAVATSGVLSSSEIVVKINCSSTQAAFDTARVASSLGTPYEVNHAINISAKGEHTPMPLHMSDNLAAEGAILNTSESSGSRKSIDAVRSAAACAWAAGMCHSRSRLRSMGPNNIAGLMPKRSHNTFTSSTVGLLRRTDWEKARLHSTSRCIIANERLALADCKASSRTPRWNNQERNIDRITSSASATPVLFTSSANSSMSSADTLLAIMTFTIVPASGRIDMDSAIASGTSIRKKAAFLIARSRLSGGENTSDASWDNSSDPPLWCKKTVVIKSATLEFPVAIALEHCPANSKASHAGVPHALSLSMTKGSTKLAM
mmetsp:Transcript_108926/g.313767  ORF Transcript_108926/g.313767 Transcript_108926/m.313767 type:complete len:496 (-) Transcript_108926:445-1932(-)